MNVVGSPLKKLGSVMPVARACDAPAIAAAAARVAARVRGYDATWREVKAIRPLLILSCGPVRDLWHRIHRPSPPGCPRASGQLFERCPVHRVWPRIHRGGNKLGPTPLPAHDIGGTGGSHGNTAP